MIEAIIINSPIFIFVLSSSQFINAQNQSLNASESMESTRLQQEEILTKINLLIAVRDGCAISVEIDEVETMKECTGFITSLNNALGEVLANHSSLVEQSLFLVREK